MPKKTLTADAEALKAAMQEAAPSAEALVAVLYDFIRTARREGLEAGFGPMLDGVRGATLGQKMVAWGIQQTGKTKTKTETRLLAGHALDMCIRSEKEIETYLADMEGLNAELQRLAGKKRRLSVPPSCAHISTWISVGPRHGAVSDVTGHGVPGSASDYKRLRWEEKAAQKAAA